MRLRPGRPDLAAYEQYVAVPRHASADRAGRAGETDVPALVGAGAPPPAVTWLGVSTVLVDDGTSAVLTDGFFSRPSLRRVGLGRIAPDEERIAEATARAGIDRLDAVLPVHTHYDHVLDSATVARRTGATVVGGRSAAQVALGHGLPEDRVLVVVPGQTYRFGAYEVTLTEGEHCPPDRFPGEITGPVPLRARARAYRCGEAWFTHLKHVPSGSELLVVGSAGQRPGALEGRNADVVYLGVGQLGLMDEEYVARYWTETVLAARASVVVLTHFDDFFRPLTAPLRALPYAGDDLDVTMQRLTGLAERDGVRLLLPRLWEPADPWAAGEGP